jgi:methionyl-tRNA formyltransferase
MRTVFIGGTKRGYLALKALVDSGAHVVGVISLRQDEHERERFEEPIRALAYGRGLAFCETRWMKDRDYGRWIAEDLGADLALIVGCRILLRKEVYEAPRRGSLAIHDSLLPEYRGFAPLNWAIINGEDHTGVTLFQVGESMDAGGVVAQRRVPIEPRDTAPSVYERVCQATVDLILETYPLLASGAAVAVPQSEAGATFACSRTPADGLIDWTMSTKAIYDQVRGLTYPYPGAYTALDGRKLTIWRVEPVETIRVVGRIPGRVTAIDRAAGYVDVLTGDGVLRIHDVELAGTPRRSAADVITSVRATLGVRAADLLARIEVLEAELAALKSAPRESRCVVGARR